jgi:hypothetical protein
MKALRLVAWFAIFGLLPFWASLVLVILGSTGRSSEYWAVAPWLVIMAIPFCGITLAMAAVTYGVYVATNGDFARKLKYAGGCFVVLSAVVLGCVAIVWNRHQAKEAELKATQEAGQVLVERSELVASTAPAGFSVSLNSSNIDSDTGVAARFTYYVRGPDSSSGAIMAIVDVSRSSTQPQLALTCIIGAREYRDRQAGIDPCQSSHAIAAK